MERKQIILNYHLDYDWRLRGEEIVRKYPDNTQTSIKNNSIHFESIDFILNRRSSFALRILDSSYLYFSKIVFSNCTFKTGLENTSYTLTFDYNSHQNITLFNCKSDILTLKRIKSVNIERCIFDSIKITNSTELVFSDNRSKSLSLDTCTVIDSLIIENESASSLTIKESKINDDFKINSCSLSGLTITKSNIGGTFALFGSRLSHGGTISESSATKTSIRDNSEAQIDLFHLKSEEFVCYRNKTSVRIHGSSISTGKINQNTCEGIEVKNLAIAQKLEIDNNRIDLLEFQNQSIDKLIFDKGSGNLVFKNVKGTQFPDLANSAFDKLTVEGCHNPEENWNLRIGQSQKLIIQNVILNLFNIETQNLDTIHIEICQFKFTTEIEEVTKLKILKLRSGKDSQICINHLTSSQIEEYEGESLSLKHSKADSLKLKQLTCQLQLESGNCQELSITNLNQGKNSKIFIEKGEQKFSIKDSVFEKLVLNINGFKEAALNKIKGDISCRLGQIESFSVEFIESARQSELALNEVNVCSIRASKFKDYYLTGDHCANLGLIENSAERLFCSTQVGDLWLISDCYHNSTIINSTKTVLLNIEFSDTTKTKDQRLKLVKTNFKTLKLHDLSLGVFEIDRASIQTIAANNVRIKDLVFVGCKQNNDILLGADEAFLRKKSEEVWLFDNAPFDFYIKKSELKRLTFNDNENSEKRKISITDSELSHLFISSFTGSLIVTSNSFFQNYTVTQSGSGSSMEIGSNGDTINQMHIVNSTCKLGIDGAKKLSLGTKNSFFNAFHISDSKKVNSHCPVDTIRINESQVSNLRLEDLDLIGLHFNQVEPELFSIRNLNSKHLSFRSFRQKSGSEGVFEMDSINTAPNHEAKVLSFVGSDISGLNLNSCYFNTFKSLLVRSTKLDEINCTATTWPKRVVSEEHDRKYFEIKEGCRQLKLAMTAHQDKVNELQFHSLEMKAYKNIVLEESKLHENWNDKLSLLAGATNGFGLNWWLPILLLFLTIFLDYLGVLWTSFDLNPFESDFWVNYKWKDFFQLLNPTHKITDLSLSQPIRGGTAALDFLSKIISAFFIYQIVAAFRKFRRN